MATTIEVYTQYTDLVMGGLDLASSTMKLALVDSGYTFSAADTVWTGGVDANEVTGTNYTAGGVAFTGRTIALGVFDADDTGWTNLTATIRRGIVYAVGTIDGIVNPVLFSILYDDTPGDLQIITSDFIPAWNTAGIYVIT